MKLVYILWLLSICILPFFQGGYFYHEALFFGLVQGMVLLFLLFVKKATFKLTGFRWMYLLILVAAIISSFTAIDGGMHFVGVLKLIVPFLFIINLDSFFAYQNKKLFQQLKLLYVVVTSIMVVILILVLLFFESEHFIFSHFVQGNRIGGFFQYANTFGMFIYGSLILMLVSQLPNKVKGFLGILFVSGLMLTQSRAILLIVIVTLLVLILINVNQLRLVALVSLSGLLTGQWILWWIKDHVEVFRGIALLDNQSPWLIRLLYYEDSIPMIIKRLTGYGHLGYYYTHQFYESGASYKVKYLHNSLLQISLDYGIVAGIALLLIGIYTTVLLVRNFKTNKIINVKDEALVLWIGSLGLFVHTLVDFDFQFTAFVILFIVMIYHVEHKYSKNVKDLFVKVNLDLKVKTNTSISVLIVCVISFFYIANVSYLDYELDPVKAYKLYPYYTDAVDGILKDKTRMTHMDETTKLEIALDTISRNPYYLNGFAFLREYYYNSGDLESAIKYAKEVYLLAPLRLDYYEIYIKMTMEQVLKLYNDKDPQLIASNEYLLDLLNIEDYINELKYNRENDYEVKHKVDFSLTEDMTRILNKAHEINNTIKE